MEPEFYNDIVYKRNIVWKSVFKKIKTAIKEYIWYNRIGYFLVILKIEYRLSRRQGGVGGMDWRGGGGGGEGGYAASQTTVLHVVYKGTQSNRVSGFRDFVCSLFPQTLFYWPNHGWWFPL